MKLIIAGSRTFHDYHRFVLELRKKQTFEFLDISEVVSGGARGVDSLAGQWASESGIPLKIFKPDYVTYLPKLAPIHRNAMMAEYGDALLALWDGMSGGTANMIANMCLLDKPVFIVKI